MNYNSKTNTFSEVVKNSTKILKNNAIFQFEVLNLPIKEIAYNLEKSQTRITQLLKTT